MTETLLVAAVIAPMHAEARVSSVQVTQRLAGHAVTVLAADGDWLRVRGEDDYEGWMHRGYLEKPPAAGLTSDAPLLSLGCTVRREPAGTTRALPLGAWLRPDERVIGGAVADGSARERLFPRDAAAIGRTAVERFAGAPYQWGGTSPWGADCSGLVQTTFWLHGVMLPRDGWQQAEVGRDVGLDPTRWAPADLAFFSDRPDRRVTHVGIALGGARMVHLALGRGGYAVERLAEGGDAYVASLMSGLVAARRVL
jgi:cell wall-associated NlpC family hydrolase